MGHLISDERSYSGDSVNVAINEEPSFDSQGNVSSGGARFLQLKLHPFHRVISDIDLARNSMLSEAEFFAEQRRLYNIPSYARISRDDQFGGIRFSWRAAKVSVSQYELIFDLDAFVPV